MSHLTKEEVLAKTIYGEAQGESHQGKRAVGDVIMNRAGKNRIYWGGSNPKNVCLKPGQFECWNGKTDIYIKDYNAYKESKEVAREVLNRKYDTTRGSDHYNNPDKEGYPSWTNNCDKTFKLGGHQFYKGKY
jgi:N-acetylmuramoyl-L-alanine amidase